MVDVEVIRELARKYKEAYLYIEKHDIFADITSIMDSLLFFAMQGEEHVRISRRLDEKEIVDILGEYFIRNGYNVNTESTKSNEFIVTIGF